MFTALLGCTTQSTPEKERFSCENSDWYQIGRRDGAGGGTLERLSYYKRTCDNRFPEEMEAMYRNGRLAGLVEYCTSENAFELGRMRIPYGHVCPSQVEETFLEAYQRGEQAHDLEVENQRLAKKIDQLNQEINNPRRTISSDDREQMDKEINDLKKARAANDKEIRQIEK